VDEGLFERPTVFEPGYGPSPEMRRVYLSRPNEHSLAHRRAVSRSQPRGTLAL
jgi:hypothetical protein